MEQHAEATHTVRKGKHGDLSDGVRISGLLYNTEMRSMKLS